MKKTELIFLPAPAPGHLVSTVEFATRLIADNPHLSITILLIQSPVSTGAPTNPIPGIRHVTLPLADSLPPDLMKDPIEHTFSAYIACHVTHVKTAITRMQKPKPENPVHIAGLFLDMFCTPMIDVAHDLNIPSYIFFASGAGFLGFLNHLPVHGRFDESEPDGVIPCFENPVPTRVIPGFAFNPLGYEAFVGHAKRFGETKGIIVNTCAELEPYALESLSNGCDTCPVYAVGPIVDFNGQVHKLRDVEERERIVRWLDGQPESSVVFLCFGSGGHFGDKQIREIARGLRESGQRFLWSMRKPPTSVGLVKPSEYTKSELRGIFDDEFWVLLEEGRGLVCGWAPQVEILAHKSVGAFVSHCGWNSALESLWFGKPIVTWPLYAEQQMDAFELVRELGVGVELTLDYRIWRGDFVEAEVVERAVRCVMDKDNPVRSKVKEVSEACRRSLIEGGSSARCVKRLISELVRDENMVVKRNGSWKLWNLVQGLMFPMQGILKLVLRAIRGKWNLF